MTQESEVELIDVTKTYGGSAAVDSVSLSVNAGEFLTLLGPSGCGKTTLLRIIGGFALPDSGKVMLAGAEVTNTPPFRRNVATVFQQYALFPHMTVAQNIAFGLERRQVERSEKTRRVAEALEMVKLDGLDTRRPAELSGGQQQRVALARALVIRPRVLLLDEPLAALDLKLRKQMQLELKELQRAVGISFVFVTHDQEEALTMSDRIAVMNAGRVQQVDEAREIYERPANEFVADFIGQSNIIEGTITEVHDGFATVKIGEWIASVPLRNGRPNSEAPKPNLQPGCVARVMVRPERMTMRKSSDGSGLPGTLLSAIYLGETTRFCVQLEPGTVVNIVEQNREGSTGPTPKPGDEVRISWEGSNCVLV